MKNTENKRFLKEIRNLTKKYKLPELEYDLKTFLWELLEFKAPPGDAYVIVCLRHKAYDLANKQFARKEVVFENFEYIPAPNTDIDLRIDIERALTKLSAAEIKLLRAIYYDDCSVAEIAQKLGISRQAVNQKKLKVFEKIKLSKCFT
jgi:RNA polymerase sigma factor (sigma-70 family)